MKLIEVISEHRNDFTGVLECEHCHSFQSLPYGYHDSRFHNQVIPAIKCISCGKRASDEIPEGISDPGTAAGHLVKKEKVEVTRWEIA